MRALLGPGTFNMRPRMERPGIPPPRLTIVYRWRRFMVNVLHRLEHIQRLSAITTYGGVGVFANPLQVAGQTGRLPARRPKDPTMPGLARLRKHELLALCETYGLEVKNEKGKVKTNEELKDMLYNAGPLCKESTYSRGRASRKSTKGTGAIQARS